MQHLADFWPYLKMLLELTLSVVASCHVILTKRDTRAAALWAGLIWLAPVVGTLLYIWLGINRIERRARSLRNRRTRRKAGLSTLHCSNEMLNQQLGQDAAHLRALTVLISKLTRRPLTQGNRIVPLVNGDQAYPSMLQAIDQAERSITLSTYIFDNDRAGEMFRAALARAVARKVEVRVLIDAMGARYSWPTMPGILLHDGIPCARFIPPLIPTRLQYSNLRTHRKILVVDGRIGFMGGINIREGHCLHLEPAHPVQDLHFQVTGPVVTQLQEVFADDWAFTTSEILQGDLWFSEPSPDGDVLARGLPDGPDEHRQSFELTLLGALACARSRILIVTPYFLPDAALITALNVAALRGVQVDIVLPSRSNIALVQWATNALLWQVVERGCRVWLSPPPFDHSKLCLIDNMAAFVGSANWDPRSLRLNFEFNLECYSERLTRELTALAEAKLASSRLVTLAELDARSLAVRLRDGLARLCAPYL